MFSAQWPQYVYLSRDVAISFLVFVLSQGISSYQNILGYVLSTKYRLGCIYSLTTDRRVIIESANKAGTSVFFAQVLSYKLNCVRNSWRLLWLIWPLLLTIKIDKNYFPQFLVSFDCKTWKLKINFCPPLQMLNLDVDRAYKGVWQIFQCPRLLRRARVQLTQLRIPSGIVCF